MTNERANLEACMLLNNLIEDSNNFGEQYFWGIFGAKKSELYGSQVLKKKFSSDLNLMNDATKDQPAFLRYARDVQQLFQREDGLFRIASEHSIYVGQVDDDHPAPTWTDLDKFKTFINLTKAFRVIKISEDERVQTSWNQLKAEQDARDKAIKRFQILLLSLVIVTAAISLVATYIVQQLLGARLRKLLASARSGLNSETELLKGNDEFSFLQTVLLKSFDSARKAAEYRAMILSMVAHDVRAPLMSAKANLNLLEEEADGLPPDTLTTLLGVYDKLDDVMQSTQDVLRPDSEVMRSLQLSSVDAEVERQEGRQEHRLKILHLLLSISLIPLIIQFVLLSQLYFRGTEIQDLSKDARNQIDAVQLKNLALIESILAVDDQFIFLATHAKALQNDAIATFAKASDHVKQLIELNANIASANQYVESFNQELNRTRDLMLQPSLYAKPISDSIMELKALAVAHDSMGSAYNSRQLEQRWRSQGRERVESDSTSLKSAAARIRKLVDMSLVITIAVEIFFAALFIRLISKEVQALTQFAGKVGRPDLDIDDRQYHTGELSELNAALIEAHQNLEAVAGLRRTVQRFLSHQLSKPLLDVLNDGSKLKPLLAELPPKCTEYLEAASRSVSQSVDILDDLLTAESLEIGAIDLNYTSFEISKMLNQCVSNLVGSAQVKNIEVAVHSSTAEVEADERRISRVISNLLSNAIKFSRKHSQINIEALQESENVIIQITDHGPGIEATELAKVFEPRYRLNATRGGAEGYGLGLAICKIIVESHHGQIRATSTPGLGSTFTLKIPKHKPS
ncbi:MAG TPA: ATP-binding protein [Drouetiella sp.]